MACGLLECGFAFEVFIFGLARRNCAAQKRFGFTSEGWKFRVDCRVLVGTWVLVKLVGLLRLSQPIVGINVGKLNTLWV
jgi:hypothetical protein